MENEKGIKAKLLIFQQYMMTGISYMLPVTVIAGMTLGITALIGQLGGFAANDPELLTSSDAFVRNVVWANQIVGKNFMPVMFMVLSGYIAFAIVDRPGLAPGFLGGMLANMLGAGFVGALLAGFFAGFTVKFLNKNIKMNRKYMGVKTMVILPVVGSFIMIILSKVAIEPIGVGFTNLSKWFVESIGQGGGITLSAALGAARSVDYGGPVSKAAGTIGKQLFFDTGYSYIACMMGVVAPIGIGLATILDKFVVGKKVFSPQLQGNGLPSLILGLLGIQEGAIPFAVADPFTIIITMIGSGVAGAMGFAFGCEIFPISTFGFFTYPLVNNIIGFLISLVTGVMIICFGMIFRANHLYKKRQEASAEA
ncbi:PTS fructose transporter subunit IIC [Isobaculum melis]|uniref:PTS system, fructose subfamily, IIC component n=1 Tax=Isobaculum melis TaxID=142588 RepID=A0A1H9TQJ2_9LACT|nr:PTS fructose transporter subunit IIC [Isobaculum melis]SER99328.1 PTS system, fructose subfamily, IIC component [Isobaculum melis]